LKHNSPSITMATLLHCRREHIHSYYIGDFTLVGVGGKTLSKVDIIGLKLSIIIVFCHKPLSNYYNL